MKQKIIWVLLIALTFVFITNCDDPVAVENETHVMHFQEGNYPTTSYIGCPDNYINSANPGYNYGTNSILYIGTTSGSTIYRMLMEFDLDNHIVEQNFTITKAYLSVYSSGYAGAATKSKIRAYPMTRSWSEGGESGSTATGSNDATWNTPNIGSWNTAGGDFESTPMSSDILDPSVKWGHFIMELNTEIIQEWMDDASANHGLILKYDMENNSVHDYFSVYSSNHADPFHRPKLTIFYKFD